MNRVDDKLYARGQKFADKMNNLLLKMRHELKTAGKRGTAPLKDKDNTGVVIGALATGLLIGSVISLLFAPEAGKNTREKITKSLKDAKGKLKDAKDKNLKKQSANIENAKAEGESALERAKKSTKEMK